MITDRIRFKKLKAGRVLDIIQHMQNSDKNEYDQETLEAVAKKIDRIAFLGDDVPGSNILNQFDVNEPFEVAELLRRLNHMINTIYMLSDTNYYCDYIFNAGTDIINGVKELGMTEEWLMELGEKFEKLRSLLYGDCIDWNEVSVSMMKNAAYALREDNQRLEDRNRQLEYKMREAERKKQE